jgi:hypothetical protein
VAKTLGGLSSIDLSSVIVYHLAKAIAIVNKRIATHKTVTNETICAVTSLTAFEVHALSASACLPITANIFCGISLELAQWPV